MVRDVHMMSVSMAEAKLKGPKEASTTGDGRPHELECAKDALPGLEGDTLLTPEFIKNGKHMGFMVVSEFKGTMGRVKHAAQDFFALHPTTVPFQCFLFGHSFFLVG